jgi:hypothetical protein
MKLNKTDVLQWVNGQKKFSSFTEKEKIQQLKSISKEDSFRQFIELSETWESMNKSDNRSEILDKLKIERLIKIRRIFAETKQ